MHNSLGFVCLAGVVVGATACKPSGSRAQMKSFAPQSVWVERVAMAGSTAPETLETYGYERREEFTVWIKAHATEVGNRRHELEGMVERSSLDVRAAQEPVLAVLREQDAQLGQAISNLGNASAETWDFQRDAVWSGARSLEGSVSRARRDFERTTTP